MKQIVGFENKIRDVEFQIEEMIDRVKKCEDQTNEVKKYLKQDLSDQEQNEQNILNFIKEQRSDISNFRIEGNKVRVKNGIEENIWSKLLFKHLIGPKDVFKCTVEIKTGNWIHVGVIKTDHTKQLPQFNLSVDFNGSAGIITFGKGENESESVTTNFQLKSGYKLMMSIDRKKGTFEYLLSLKGRKKKFGGQAPILKEDCDFSPYVLLQEDWTTIRYKQS